MAPVLLNPSRFGGGGGGGGGYAAAVAADGPALWYHGDAVDLITVAAATASSNYPSDTPAQAFDGNPVTPWSSNGTSTGWIRAQLSSAKILTDYVLTSRASFPTRAPKNWTFEGSNDGSTWTTLDTRTGVTWTSGQTRAFSFANSTAYLYYRLNVTLNNGDTYLDLAEMSFPYSLDSSGNGRYLLQPSGAAPTITTGGPVLNNVLQFGSSAGWLRSAYEQATPGVGTFELLLNFPSPPASALTLMSWSPNNGGNGSTLYLQLLTNGKIRLNLWNGSTVVADCATALSTGTWHHVIGSVGAAAMKVRVDKTNTGSNTPTAASSPATAAFRIHGHYDGTSHVAQTGAVLIAEAAWYAAQLSDAATNAHADAI